MKPWNGLKLEYNFKNELHSQWLQLKHAIPRNWKTSIKLSSVNVSDLLVQDHDQMKGSRILALKKLSSKKLYLILISKFTDKPSANAYFERLFPNIEFDSRNIYILPRKTTINTYLCSFKYKILNNILF